MKFGFVAEHRGIWPVALMCGALGVSRGGFYAWLHRPRSQRELDDEELGKRIKQSFIDSDRTYGARRAYELQRLGGWKTGAMVERYAHVAPEALQVAAMRLDQFSGYETATPQRPTA